MKLKSVLVVALLATCSTVGFSQIRFGAKLGLNVSKINFSEDDGTDIGSRLAPVLGGFAEIGISDKFAFQPELVYSMEGTTASMDYLGTTVDMTFKTDYLNLPLLAKYKFGNGLSLHAGPQFGFLMGAKLKAEAGGEEETEDAKDMFNGMNTSIALGAAYELESGLGFDLRYNAGLSNILEDSGDETGKLSTLQISAFYKF